MATAFKQVADNAISSTATNLSSTGVTSITLSSGDGAKFPQPGNGFWLTLWDNNLYPNNPGADPNMEKVTCSARVGDILTISATTKAHASPCAVALLDVSQNITDLQTAVNTAETNIASNTTAISTETSRAQTAEGNLVPKTTTVNGHALSSNVVIAENDIANLTTDLAAKATDSLVVHLSGTETITGPKTLTAELDILFDYAAFKVKNSNSSQFAGAGFYLVNTPSTMASQAGASFYMGINNVGATQGFLAIDKTDTSGTGTGHLVLFDYNANQTTLYQQVLLSQSGSSLSPLTFTRSDDGHKRFYVDGFGAIHFGGLSTLDTQFQLDKDSTNTNLINLKNIYGPASILILDSDTSASGGPNAESTFTGRVHVNSSSVEFIDWYHNNYSTNGDIQYGIMMQKTGTGVYHNFEVAYQDNAQTNSSLQVKDREVTMTITPTLEIGTSGGIAISGTGAKTSGSAAVVGTGTAFTTTFQPGDSFAIGTEYGNVLSVTDDTHLTANANFTVTGSGYTIKKFNRFMGQIGIRNRNPQAFFHIAGGIGGSTVGSASLKIDAATALLTTPENGAIENSGTHLYVTLGGTRYQLDQQSGFVNPMTTLGDIIYENGTPAPARLAGDTSNARKFLRTQSASGVAQAPAWDTLQAGDIPNLSESQVTNLTTDLAARLQLGGDLSGSATAPTVKSRVATVTIAPSGTAADYNTTGTNDNTVIQSAINAAAAGSRIVLRDGTYNLGAKLTVPSNITLEGESRDGTILKLANATNVTMLGNADTTNGNTKIVLRNLTIDQNGANQTSGGGLSFTGITDSILENLWIKSSQVFNLFVGSLAGTTQTGTATFTNGSETVVGVGTSFTTALAPYSIVKSAGGNFARVLSITDNTHLVLDRPWGWTTESGVAFNLVPANARNKIINCVFDGTIQVKDNVGLGLFDDSLVQGNISRSSQGYGLGPDHTNRTKFIGNTLYSNSNAGIGMETCGYCTVSGNVCYANGSGVYLLSGSYRNVVSGNTCFDNANGINLSYNTTTYPPADSNTVSGNVAHHNSASGIRVGGVLKTIVSNNRATDNVTGGITLVTENAVAPTDTLIEANQCYDSQTTKTQAYGIDITGGTNTLVANNVSYTTDNLTGGINDAGTGTIIVTPRSGGLGVKNNNPGNPLSVNTPTTPDSLPQTLIATGAATNKGLVIQGAASQTANAFEYQSSAGNNFSLMTSGGLFRGPFASAAAPTFSFVSEGGTGMYRPSGTANTLRFSVAANDALQLNTNGATFYKGIILHRTAVGNVDYAILSSDCIIAYTSLTAPHTATLPDATATDVVNKYYIIKDESGTAASHNITIATTSAQTIDGASTKVINTNYGYFVLYSDGANWQTVAAPASAGTVAWGSITGTLSSQTDLQAALDAKTSKAFAVAMAVALG